MDDLEVNVVPELLAPAGNLDTAIAALEHGADAVYCGLKKFNARERTENFNFEDLSRLIRYGRANGKKVYLTFNTLIKDQEINEAYHLLERIASIEPDAVIIQDLGIYKIITSHFPNLAIHASTQMGVHNSAGVALLEKLGFERVILERQITLDELKIIKQKTSLGLEVFIHGALCCSLSGVCLFSSWMGGWSGNRGKCKQPCRRRYVSDEGNGFFFSTNDLYSLEDIPRLKEIGVASLKIEGRLKRADYVVPVVEAYRLLLDSEQGSHEKVLSEARLLLSRSGGRYWSGGFRSKEEFDAVINHTRLGVSGSLVGKVKAVRSGGFSIVPKVPISVDDELRVQPASGDEGPSFTVTKIDSADPSRRLIPANREGFIFCTKTIPPSGFVYKIGYSTKSYLERVKKIEPFEVTVSLAIDVRPTEFVVRTTDNTFPLPEWKKEVSFSEARTKPLDKAGVEAEFRKDNSWYSIKSVTVTVENNPFCSPKELRNIRQAFYGWLEKQRNIFHRPQVELNNSELVDFASDKKSKGTWSGSRDANRDIPLKTTVLSNCSGDAGSPEWKALLRKLGAGSTLADGEKDSVQRACPLTETNHSEDEAVLPSFVPEDELPPLEKLIKKKHETGVRRFRITSLFGFTLLRQYEGVEIICSFPLPAANRFAFSLLFSLGADIVQSWVELEKNAVLPLIEKFGPRCEVYMHGRLPVLQTRAILPVEGNVQDTRGAGFFIERKGEITSVYPESVFSVEGQFLNGKTAAQGSYRFSRFYDTTKASIDEEKISVFNLRRELV